MKILQIINSHAVQDGGAQRLAQQFHRAYLSRGHDAHLLSLMRSPVEELPNAYSLGFSTPYHPLVLPKLRAFLRQSRWRDCDVIHVHLFPSQLYVPLALRSLGRETPRVTTEHNTHNRRRESVLWRDLDRAVYRSYARIACISDGTRVAMAQWLPEIAPRLCTILNGIAPAPQGASTRASTRVPLIVSLGRISEQKNYATAIRALALLPRGTFRYHIAGKTESPSLQRALELLVRELKLENEVRLLGFRENSDALLQDADIYLSTSRWEGFGLAVAEAMAAGIAVVAADVEGVREVIGSDVGTARCGILVEPNAPQAFANALQPLLENAALRHQIGDNARRRARAFDIENTIESYLALYQQTTDEHRARLSRGASTRAASEI